MLKKTTMSMNDFRCENCQFVNAIIFCIFVASNFEKQSLKYKDPYVETKYRGFTSSVP